MRIGITVNGVLRDTLYKIIKVYNLYNETELVIEDIETTNLLDHLDFKTEEELLDWLYVECPMEVFGNCPSVTDNTVNDLNRFYKTFRDEHKITIYSEEIGKSKSATLFFLAKYGCLVDNIGFFGLKSIYTDLWDSVDLLITSDITLLETKPENKITVKVKTKFNSNVNSDFTIDELSTIFELEMFKNEEEEITE
tara:strand:- start:3928 stop:4512 length:585 start_codon:yes stop_codon:yes gene_type:complete